MITINKLLAAALTAVIGLPALAQEKPSSPVHVKVIRVVDGDSTVTEHDIDESQLPSIEENLGNASGKNVKVMMMVTKEGEIAREDLEEMRMPPLVRQPGDKDVIMHREIKPGELRTGFRFETEEDKGRQKMVVRTFCADSAKRMVREFEGVPGAESRNEVIMKDAEGRQQTMVMVRTVRIVDEGKEPTAQKKASKTEKPETEGNVNFYPNPNNGKFTMDFESDGKHPITITITDMSGREVYKEEVKGEGKLSRTIDISNESKGSYIMTMQQGKKSKTKKIIIE